MKKAVLLLTVLMAVLLLRRLFCSARQLGGWRKRALAIAAGFGMQLRRLAVHWGKERWHPRPARHRSPSGAAGAIRAAMILGLVSSRPLALFTLAIIMLKA